MPPKPRLKVNKPLPKRWRHRHGAYYYCVPKKVRHLWDNRTEFRLGSTLSEAYKVWAERLELEHTDIANMSDLMDRYLLEVAPTKSFKSQESNQHAISKLRPAFGAMLAEHIKPKHAYQYYHYAAKERGPTTAKHDIQTLRHILSMAVVWGVIDVNPLIGQLRPIKRAWQLHAACRY